MTAERLSFALGEAFKSRVGDLGEAPRIHVLDDPVEDDLLSLVARIHVAQHALKEVGGKDVSEDIENLARAAGSRSSSICEMRSNSFCSTRPSAVLVATKLKMRQSFS